HSFDRYQCVRALFFRKHWLAHEFYCQVRLEADADVDWRGLPREAFGRGLGSESRRDGPAHILGSGIGQERARGHGNDSRASGAASWVNSRNHVRSARSDGSIHFHGFGSGNTFSASQATDVDTEGCCREQTLSSEYDGPDQVGSFNAYVRDCRRQCEQLAGKVFETRNGTRKDSSEWLGKRLGSSASAPGGHSSSHCG